MKKGEKATIPEIEYCPICGMSEEMAKDAGRKNGWKISSMDSFKRYELP